MSDPTYSGYLKWITAVSFLGAIVGFILCSLIYIGTQYIFLDNSKKIGDTAAILMYVVPFVLIWIFTFLRSTYEGYLKRE